MKLHMFQQMFYILLYNRDDLMNSLPELGALAYFSVS